MIRLRPYQTLSDTSISSIYVRRPHRCFLTRQRSNIKSRRQWMLCRAFGEIAISIHPQTAFLVPPLETSLMPRSVSLLAICSKIIWDCRIASLWRICRSLNRLRRSIHSACPLHLARLRRHHRNLRVQQCMCVPQPMCATGNLVPRHLRRATN
jgi:hypothetical protein